MHFKRKLNRIAHDLFLKHGWEVPAGFRDGVTASLSNVTVPEWQAAKRRGRNAIDQRQFIKQCFDRSDSSTGFQAALKEHGMMLARGHRCNQVIVTVDGQIIAVARAVGRRTTEVSLRLGDHEMLPNTKVAQATL